MYYVDTSVELRKKIKYLHSLACDHQRGVLFIRSLRSMHERLSYDPFEFGEPLYTLPLLSLTIRTASIFPIVITYSVSKDNPIVMRKSIELLEPA